MENRQLIMSILKLFFIAGGYTSDKTDYGGY